MAAVEDVALALIDGTGPADDALYELAMGSSFCRQLAGQYSLKQGQGYWRGPSASGNGLGEAVAKAAAFVTRSADAGRANGRRIVLVGYSRGGLGCILAAHKLKSEGRQVHGLVLLDPVDRYLHVAPYKPIPNNVHFSFRAFRSLNSEVVLEWEGTLPGGARGLAANPMRPGFSSAGLSVEAGPYSSAANHLQVVVVGSHGALGGSGYTWLPVDAICQERLTKQIAGWWTERLGSFIRLTPGWDPTVPKPRKIEGRVDKLLLRAGRATTKASLIMHDIDRYISGRLHND